MGAWLYDDPSFALRSVTVKRVPDERGGSADSLELDFLGCNRNDYDLMSDGLSARLQVSGRTVAAGERDQPVFMGTRDTSGFVIVVPLQEASVAHPAASAKFELMGAGTVHAPMGNRPVAFRLRGRIEPNGEGVRWLGEGNVACRPGLSQLPGQFTHGAAMGGDDTTSRRPNYPTPEPSGRPGMPGSPTQPNSGPP